MIHFVNWTNQLAIHQSAFMRALVDLGWRVTMVVDEAVSPDRQKMGWSVPDFNGVNVIVRPDRKAIDRLLQENRQETVHVFGAAINYVWGWYALFRAAQLKNQMGLMMEAADPDGWKGPLRWVKYSTLQILLGQRVHFVLGIGMLGVRWFTHCGFSQEKVFPFGYFVEDCDDYDLTLRAGSEKTFHILFVGQLVQLKRVDLLIRALSRLPLDAIRLSIAGNGPERACLEGLTRELSMEQYIDWLDALSNQQVRKLMAEADLLVLPSRYDGWGAVVNEALMAGTPVICTDYCGAADLLGEDWRGEVVPRNNVDALAAAIKRRMERRPVTQQSREEIRKWSECISGRSAALYLQGVIEHVYNHYPKPVPPWQKGER